METPFGIDLGTTCSAIGWLVDGRPRLIRIGDDTLVPSVVRFESDGSAVVGTAALNQLALHPDTTLRSTKRHIGTDKTWTVGEREVGPVDAAAAILGHLADGAETATGVRPKDVVITVPAWFSHSARADTQAAAERAGLNVVRLINEPTAAALARDFEDDTERKYMVFDLGGGTFDASLISQSGAFVEVLASHGDTWLGGDDLDEALLEDVLDALNEGGSPLPAAVRGSSGAWQVALAAVRDAKHALSADLEAMARAPFLAEVNGDPVHLEAKVDRSDLEEALEPLLERAFACVDEVLKAAGVPASAVNDVLLVGGSTRSPRVREALLERYGWEGDASIPAQDAVALGATIQAGIVAGVDVRATLVDVTPHALSVTAETEGPNGEECLVASTITPRNATLPARHTHRFWTMSPRQKRVEVVVMQGSHPNPLRNVALGEVAIEDLPPAPEGQHNRPIAIELRHDLSGVVSVSVRDELTGRSEVARIALSGVESAEARAKLRESIERDGLLPGDGSDPDPFFDLEESEAEEAAPAEPRAVAAPSAAPIAADDPALADARRAFEAIEANVERLKKDHADVALDLYVLSTRGRTALSEGRAEDARNHYDEVADLMFEHGIYL